VIKELPPGEVTWKAFKDKMWAAGVDDDSIVKFMHLYTQKPGGLTVFALSITEEMNSNFKAEKSIDVKAIEYESHIRYLMEDLNKLRKERDEDKWNIRVLQEQIDKLRNLLCTCQQKLFDITFPELKKE